MKIPFVLQAIFGMLLIASAPLNRRWNQEIRTVCEQECAPVTRLVQRGFLIVFVHLL